MGGGGKRGRWERGPEGRPHPMHVFWASASAQSGGLATVCAAADQVAARSARPEQRVSRDEGKEAMRVHEGREERGMEQGCSEWREEEGTRREERAYG